MYPNESIETLKRLGLTALQAKIYVSLLVLENATVKSVSKAAGVARHDVYRIMPALQKRGLVKKVISTPATYKATPIKDGASILLQKKKEEFSVLQTKTATLLSGMQKNKHTAVFEEEDDLQFRIVYDRKLLFKKFEKGNKTCKKSIECSGTLPDIKRLLTKCNCLDDHFSKAMQKGVKIRIITENRGDDKALDDIIAAMCKNPLFDIKFVPAPMPVKLVLYDGEEANTSISTSTDTDMPSLWSNNPNFVRIMEKQFEDMWSNGTNLNDN
ncbi:MAG: hypothetical protein NWF00_11145 [Candidatus Bathyarchaeota archaeon]|nr:hypothetical protein [Candidatus Bathyarchaeota archaeon]